MCGPSITRRAARFYVKDRGICNELGEGCKMAAKERARWSWRASMGDLFARRSSSCILAFGWKRVNKLHAAHLEASENFRLHNSRRRFNRGIIAARMDVKQSYSSAPFRS